MAIFNFEIIVYVEFWYLENFGDMIIQGKCDFMKKAIQRREEKVRLRYNNLIK